MKLRKRKSKRHNHPNDIGYSEDRQESAEKRAGAKKNSKLALLMHQKSIQIFHQFTIYSKNLIPIIFEPMAIKFYFVETSVYYIIYRRLLRLDSQREKSRHTIRDCKIDIGMSHESGRRRKRGDRNIGQTAIWRLKV
jgi:hypothetical protein